MILSQSSNLLNVYLAPKASFSSTDKLKSATWLSLLLIIGLTVVSNLTFYADMSPEWIVEQQTMQMTDMSDIERQQVATYMMESAPYTGYISAVISSVLFLITTFMLTAYFSFVGRNDSALGFKEWFALSVKMQLPLAINILIFMLIFMTAGHPEQPISLVNYASLNQLVFGLDASNAYYNLLENINVFYIWSILIGAYGVHALLNKSIAKSMVIAGLPYLVVFALWALAI